MSISKSGFLKTRGVPDVRQLVENNDFLNEAIRDSYDYETPSLEIQKIELEDTIDTYVKKREILRQVIELLNEVVCCGELNHEINQLKDSLKITDEIIKDNQKELEQVMVKTIDGV